MVDLFSQNLLSLEPPREPTPPIKPDDRIVPGYAWNALGVGILGALIGSFAGGLLGIGVSIIASSNTPTLAERHSAGSDALIGTIVICALIGAVFFFAQSLSEHSSEAQARRNRAEAYRRGKEQHKEDMAAYKQALKDWPVELERRKALNADITKAKQAEHIKREKRQIAERYREEWDQTAAIAFNALLNWRTEFFADCVARHGYVTPEDLERLYVEAYPYSPVSRDPRMGCLHYFLKDYPFIVSISKHLPREILRP